ncbi:precorrin-2 C(20)-methyltransferase [Telmatospirillum sp. J64-1]|uniref:precorrin-2 C(20)-methyltransferase n=1 Tax=Telmatospirillum sp. J64-1 TaxID=2502183 RepID=UPI00115D235F|nr:precorrin-2 C(20)-methyltransferase [Telmatospirillum sp. J64-1]
MSGTLYGLGVGPGDPELLTLKALRLLKSCPTLAYLAGMSGESMARGIVAEHLTGQQREIVLPMSFDPAPGAADAAYDQGAQAIAEELAAGRDVAVLCEGDPFFFGSFQYLYNRLSGRFPVQVVPGVSSVMAASAELGLPLTARNDALAVIPATRPEEEIAGLLDSADAAAIMKLGRHLPRILDLLDRLGLSEKARYIERVGLPAQRILSLAEARASGAPYFSIILISKRSAVP